MSFALTEAQSAVFDLLESSPYPSFVVDAQTFRICKASQSAADFYQYPKKELLHLSFIDLHTAFFQRELISKLKSNKSFIFSLAQQKKDGSICNVELNASLLPSDLNTYYHITVVDCSKWMNQINRYQSYIEQSSEAVWRYELREPVSIYLPEDEIIEHIHRHAYLAECNNRFAEMYQFSDSTQLLSTSLELIFDFSRPENIEYLRTFIRNNYNWMDAERKYVDADDNVFYFSSNLVGIVEDGFLKGGWGTQRNITEKKKIELELKESEDRFRELADTAPAMIWICDENNKTTYVNRSWIEFTGIDLTNKLTEDWAAIIHPADRQQTIEACRNAAKQKESVTVTYRLLDQKGNYKWVVDTSTPRFTKNGRFIGYIGSLIDITDQKEKEEQLRYQSTLFENVSDIVVTTDLNFVVKTWNKVAEEYYGLIENQVAGKRIDDLLAFDYISATKEEALQELLSKGKWIGEVIFENSQGEKRHLWQTVAFVYDDAGEKVGVMAVGRDITQQKASEQKLEQSELFYKNLIKDSMDGMILIDTNYIITFVSPAIKHILGFEVEEVLGKNAFEFIHPKDIAWAAESLQREIQNNPVIKSISIRLLKKNGEWLWCMVRGHNLFSNPYVNSVVIYFHDDTLRKTANEKLKASEERFRHLISELQVGVLMQDSAAEVLLCNKMATQILGISEEKLIGRRTHDYLHDVIHESGKRFADDEFAFHAAVRTKKPVRNKVMGIWRTSTNDRVWILVNAEPIIGENGEVQHVICSFADITERKMLEQKLIAEEVNHQRLLTQATIDGQEQERKEIGKELHDNIGQQLTTTKLYLDLAKSTADDSTNELISLALKSVSDVINEIRSISHSLVPPSLGDLGLYESLKELTDSIRRTQMIDIRLDFLEVNEHELPDNKKLMVYRIVQEQLNNIVKHANASEIFVSVFNDEKHFLIEVKDNGNGFDMATVRKGLGLSNIQNRAELFGGRVAVNTAPGKGCLLKVLIPHQLN